MVVKTIHTYGISTWRPRLQVKMEENTPSEDQTGQKMFTLKKWNAVAMWSWDFECDTCTIFRVQVMGKLGIY